MIRWALGFFIVAVCAGILHFGGIAAGASDIAPVCCFLCIVLFAATLIFGIGGRTRDVAFPAVSQAPRKVAR